MAIPKALIGVVGIAALVAFSQTAFTVDQRETALVAHFGDVTRIIKGAGLHFKWPFADEVISVEKRTFMWHSDKLGVQVSDKQRYLVDIVTLVRISDPLKFRETVQASLEFAKQRIDTRLNAALRQTYGKRTFEAALSKDRQVMMAEIRDQVRAEAQALGIEIVDVRIKRTDLMPEVMDATYERMKSERIREVNDLRGEGQALKTSKIAEADRKVLEIVSEGNRQSEIIRGEGDAERSNIYAAAYGKDPEFYAFYRSLQAYQTSLASGGTSLVLSPDSDFFKYFGSQKDKSQVPTPAQ
jgi:modulator of FtsH protease HflC